MTDPLTQVRRSAQRIAAQARFVHIDEAALAALAERIAASPHDVPPWDDDNHFRAGSSATAQYLLVLDGLNFCFWPAPTWEYDRLARSLKETMLVAPHRFRAEALATATESDVRAMLGDADDIPLLSQRTALLNELGSVLAARWQGQASQLVAAAAHSAAELVRLVTAELPGFRDHAIYQGWPVYFYKRAQIFVGDLYGAFAGDDLGHFDDIDRLTMFADYRIPQLLRAEGVLRYNARLASIVDLCRELPSGSDLEIEIRGCTIHAVEGLRDRLHALDVRLNALHLDWLLWNEGEQRRTAIAPAHCTRTIYY
ncbi:MAG: queuosine salvage family protein [Anaerolineales bacterium]|nr:queuosine salvage family protein [Anaerolineales bacterium]